MVLCLTFLPTNLVSCIHKILILLIIVSANSSYQHMFHVVNWILHMLISLSSHTHYDVQALTHLTQVWRTASEWWPNNSCPLFTTSGLRCSVSLSKECPKKIQFLAHVMICEKVLYWLSQPNTTRLLYFGLG